MTTTQALTKINGVPQTAIIDAEFTTELEPKSLVEAHKLAAALLESNYMGIKSTGDMLGRVLFGREYGLGAMTAIASVYVVNGRPSLDATAIHALCLRHPKCKYFRPISVTPTEATFETWHADHPEPMRHTVTMEQMAKVMNGEELDTSTKKLVPKRLVDKDNWKNYPTAMLAARCKSELARLIYPDAVRGLMAREEAQDHADVETRELVASAVDMHQLAAKASAKTVDFDAERDRLLKLIADAASLSYADERAFAKTKVHGEIKASANADRLPEPWRTAVKEAFTAAFAPAPKGEAPVEDKTS